MYKRSPNRLYCFSPPVMLATFIIEIVLVCYTLWRYKLGRLTRLVAVSLVSLAVFQLCEYNVCTGWGPHVQEWSRLGFICISLLPALGLHIMHVLADKKGMKLVLAAYTTTAAVALFFLFAPSVFISYICTGNYVIFQLGRGPAIANGVYYYSWLTVAMTLGFWWISRLSKAAEKYKKQINAMQGLIIGYLVFLVPTAVAYSVSPQARSAIPSIMCGFAVIFALILSLYITPLIGKRRNLRDGFLKSLTQ